MGTHTARTTRATGIVITMVLMLTGWGLMGAGAPVGNAQADQPKIVVSINNVGGVRSGPTAPSTFVTNEAWLMTEVWTYHWNGGRGAPPGQISIEDTVTGKVYGPWTARGEPGQGGVLNAYWVARADMVLPAGSYRFIDSDPATWAQNAESGGRGFAWIYARPATGATTPTNTAPPATTATVASMDGVERGTCSKVSVLWETYSGAWTVTTKSKSTLSANSRILNEPQQEARPRFTSPVVVTRVETYHWNAGLGDAAGTIELRRDAGAVFPPWPAQAVTDTKGNRNVIWRVDTGGVVAPSGSYTLIDSRRPTWSTNKTAGLAGIARVLGCKRSGTASPAPATTAPGRVTPTSVVGIRSLPGGCTSPRPISPYAGLTALPMTAAGRYTVYWGASGADGLQTPTTWEAFGPFDLRSGSRYKATLGANGGMQWVENPAEVLGAGPVGAGFAVVHAAQDRGATTATFWTVAVCSGTGSVAAVVDTPATSAAPATGCAAIPGVWSWFTNGDVTFRADGTLTQGSLTGRWTCTDGRVSVSWSHGYYDTLTLSADGRSLSGFGSTDPRATSGFSVSGRKK